MRFILELDCDNAAFSDDPYAETSTILNDAARHVRQREWVRTLMDTNGNTIGKYQFVESERERGEPAD